MILSIILIIGLIFSLLSMLCFDWVNNFSDFWIVIVSFIVGILSAIILIALVVVIGALFVRKDKEYEKPSKFHVRVVYRVCEFLITVLRIKVNLRGMDQIPTDKRFLFITNHQSLFDSVSTAWILRAYNIQFVLKESLITKPILGQYLHACGYIPLNRVNPREGVKTINKAADRISSDTSSIVICPEGTRSGGYTMNEFHNGSFKIGTKSKCPIVLCAIQNTSKIMKRFPWKSTEIYFDVIETLNYEDYSEKTTQEISDYCYGVVKESLDSLPKYEES